MIGGGFGGALPSGEAFAVVAFSRVEIPPNVAELFRYLALNAKLALLPFSAVSYFEEGTTTTLPTVHDSLVTLSIQGATAADLLRTYVTLAADWLDRSRQLAELSGQLGSVLDEDRARTRPMVAAPVQRGGRASPKKAEHECLRV
jgi:hypothetical protein